ncbi:MAG TPA: histidine kinase, partial [Thermoanaerobacterales bacterium]|nr:histidine kinase [Thermoanaerobacterales bacterium]
MFAKLDKNGTINKLEYILKQVDDDKNLNGSLILACDANDFTPDNINHILKTCKKPVFGGVFSHIIYNNEKLEKGTIVVGIKQTIKTVILENLSNSTDLGMESIMKDAFKWQDLQDKTMFVFLDGFSENTSKLVDNMFNNWGIFPNYIGGGAGSLDMGEKPCVITEKGLLEDAVVFALIDLRSGIGVAHGWRPIAGPFKVTEADGNTVITLNWRPAFKVYKEIVEKISEESFSNWDFFQLAKEFPFGIAKMSNEMVVRDVISLNRDKLICVGEVPVNSFVYILNGNKDSLVEGAAKARMLAEKSYRKIVDGRDETPKITFFMDCVSRVLCLDSYFDKELEAVYKGNTLVGALSIGEIANTGQNYIEFYNKTSIIGLLG